jgi:hypothetical protein
MPSPVNLTAGHLFHAVVPAAPDVTAGDPLPTLAAGIDRIDALLRIADAQGIRIVALPDPPQQQTLAELVQAARRRLRGERVRLASEELGARRFVLDRVREGIVA